jgi:hypothetical protein
MGIGGGSGTLGFLLAGLSLDPTQHDDRQNGRDEKDPDLVDSTHVR